MRLVPVCKYLYNVMHDPSLWRTVCSDVEFTLFSFNCLFRHDKDLRHVGLRHSLRSLSFISDEFLIENTLLNCTNLTSLDLANNTSIFSLHFVQHMSSLKYLDITNCQNITIESLVSSLYKKKTIEILHMTNCFQVSGNALVTVVKSLKSVRIF